MLQLNGIEPGPHFGARTRAGQKTQLRIEPVARRPTRFRGNYFNGLSRGQARQQRHHLPIDPGPAAAMPKIGVQIIGRSEEHTSELQSLMRISYAVFCWKK